MSLLLTRIALQLDRVQSLCHRSVRSAHTRPYQKSIHLAARRDLHHLRQVTGNHFKSVKAHNSSIVTSAVTETSGSMEELTYL